MGRGASKAGRAGGTTAASTTTVQSVNRDVDDFLDELNGREYGNAKGMISDARKKEYRDLKYQIDHYIDTFGDDGNLVVFSSGFANNENYIHTTAKLNAYQHLVRTDARGIKTDLGFGIINANEAAKELKVLKSIDATIKNRRKILKE